MNNIGITLTDTYWVAFNQLNNKTHYGKLSPNQEIGRAHV